MADRNAAQQSAQPSAVCSSCGAPARVNPRTGGYRHVSRVADFLCGYKRGQRAARGRR